MEFKTRQQLAAEYGIDRKTLMKRIDEAQLRIPSSKRICPKDVLAIYSALGYPIPQKSPFHLNSPQY